MADNRLSMTARSYLFVPGDRADMLAKVGTRGADAVIADLEDAVAPAARADARAIVRTWLAGLDRPGFQAWVRIGSPTGEQDLDHLGGSAPAGLMVPKVRSAEELHVLAARLDEFEAGGKLDNGQIRLLPIVETAAALRALDPLAAAPRVHQLMIGELDLSAELGIDPGDEDVLLPLRMQVVTASAAAGISPPLGPVSPNFTDLAGFEAETRRLARLGFGSRPAIHPAQVPIINAVFTPSPAEVARAQRLVAAYDAALAQGKGAVVDEDGHMVDEAVARIARRLLGRAGAEWE